MSLPLEGRVALVTGASGGLGEHFSHTLAQAGATVAVAARRLDRLEATRGALGARAIALPLDVADAASVRACVAATVERLGSLDILVNNAGVTVAKPLLEIEEADWDHVLDTNLKGCFLMAQEAARAMIGAGRGGSIVNVASILGLRVSGLVRLSQAMALELARHQIRVNALCPGYIETEINHEFFTSPAGAALVKRIPQRRLGRMQDLDGPLLLLCSDAGAYMTGAVLAVDGGQLVNTL